MRLIEEVIGLDDTSIFGMYDGFGEGTIECYNKAFIECRERAPHPIQYKDLVQEKINALINFPKMCRD
ncbi:unnamed protein product [Leptosia nina]|uniref:Uncharacterized protein n=1 Tax=Leptosia nina TaxID=320188 RepID=A0AAV1JBR9_9NEOP